MNKPKYRKPEYYRQWDSPSAFVASVRAETPGPMSGRSDLVSELKDKIHMSREWCLGATLKQSLVLATEGWQEGASQIARLADPIVSVVAQRLYRPEPVYGTDGDFFDVGRVCSGEPEHWIRWEQAESDSGMPQQHGPITIAYDTGASSHVSSATMIKRGAVVAALAWLLELSGRPCEIVAILQIPFGASSDPGGRDPSTVHAVVIKRASAPIHVASLAFWLVHPAAMRRCLLRAVELMPGALRGRVSSNYGRPVNPNLTGYQADIVLGPAMLGSEAEKEPQGWILARLAEQGIQVTEQTRIA